METELKLDDKNLIVMKLLHYFITEKNYNPIILQGVENEIWLENLNEDYKVIRIVSGHIHNDEQFAFDIFKTKRIVKKIKRKTFSLNVNVLSFFLDLGENVTKELEQNNKLICVKVQDENDIKKNEKVTKLFPDLKKKLVHSEKGVELFVKITNDINDHNKEDANKIEKVFKSKFPTITYILIALNVIFFVIPVLFGQYNNILNEFCVHGPSIRYGQYYRIITGIFLHGSLLHLLFNCYALYAIGTQLESFLGKPKYLAIYLFSGIIGSLFSMTFSGSAASVGASGAIFGLMGALVYFGYHYRVYLGNVVRSQIIPLILLNLTLGFISTGIDNAAHIGGLIGGALITVGLGIKDKSSTFERVNGLIVSAILLAFCIYMGFIYAA